MREIRCRVELREDADRRSPGRITGTLLTYNERARDRLETFVAGSLSWASEGVVLRRQHNRSEPILRFLPEVREGAVIIDTALPDTVAGRSAAVEIRGGLFKGLSVEFVPKPRTEPGRRPRDSCGRARRRGFGRFAILFGIVGGGSTTWRTGRTMAVTIDAATFDGSGQRPGQSRRHETVDSVARCAGTSSSRLSRA